MEADQNEFTRRNVRILTITAQKIDGLLHARRFVRKHNYGFPILFDETRQVTKDYGVFHGMGIDAYRIARPAAFVLDKAHRIRWVGVAPNQTEWPRTPEILKIIDRVIEAAGKY